MSGLLNNGLESMDFNLFPIMQGFTTADLSLMPGCSLINDFTGFSGTGFFDGYGFFSGVSLGFSNSSSESIYFGLASFGDFFFTFSSTFFSIAAFLSILTLLAACFSSAFSFLLANLLECSFYFFVYSDGGGGGGLSYTVFLGVAGFGGGASSLIFLFSAKRAFNNSILAAATASCSDLR